MPPIIRRPDSSTIDPIPYAPTDDEPSPETKPDYLAPYRYHGLDLRIEGAQAVSDCPFCGKSKLSIEITTGRYRCWVCGEGNEKGGGNIYTFLRSLHDASSRPDKELETLRKDRSLLKIHTLIEWGIAQSPLTREWLLPGYSNEKKLNNLYRYIKQKDGKMALYPTKGLGHYYPGGQFFDKRKGTIFLVEGAWNAMCLYETIKMAKDGSTLSLTSDSKNSLLNECNILAIPGCQVFIEAWIPLFTGKRVVFIYDSDHPKQLSNGKITKSAGYSGMVRAINLTASHISAQPKEMLYLLWGKDGYDSSLKHGYDLRDYFSQSDSSEGRVELLDALLKRLEPVPKELITVSPKKKDIEYLPCKTWKELIESWHEAMEFIEGLDRSLACMIAAVVSVPLLGEPLWFRIVCPPSGGKSTLCEAISANRECTLAVSSMTGFYSGYKTDKDGEEDHSLIAKLNGKCLVTKDGDPLMKGPQADEILADGRDIYDGISRKHFKNGIGNREYQQRIGWIIAGTGALRIMDKSELGERFLTSIIMEEMDFQLERNILRRVIRRSEEDVKLKSNCSVESSYNPKVLKARQLTAGYIDYLSKSAELLIAKLSPMTEQVEDDIAYHAMFVAYMRARPSTKQDETTERELAFRVASQLTRLASLLCIILNKTKIDSDVLRRVKRVAMDTAQGKTLKIINLIYQHQVTGVENEHLKILIGGADDKETTKLLKFLAQINVLEKYSTIVAGVHHMGIQRWRLTSKFLEVYKKVVL